MEGVSIIRRAGGIGIAWLSIDKVFRLQAYSGREVILRRPQIKNNRETEKTCCRFLQVSWH